MSNNRKRLQHYILNTYCFFSFFHPKKYFTHAGELRLQTERYSLFQLLTERQNWPSRIAKLFADFLLMMLNSDPHRRATAAECLEHPFMRETFDFSELQNRYERESYYSRSGSSYASSASEPDAGAPEK